MMKRRRSFGDAGEFASRDANTEIRISGSVFDQPLAPRDNNNTQALINMWIFEASDDAVPSLEPGALQRVDISILHTYSVDTRIRKKSILYHVPPP